jgi:hypothetical protein
MLAQGRGVSVWNDGAYVGEVQEFCERFAALVAAAEREQCAKVCDGIRYSGYCPPEDGAAPDYYNSAAAECAVAIRARGESKCPATK